MCAPLTGRQLLYCMVWAARSGAHTDRARPLARSPRRSARGLSYFLLDACSAGGKTRGGRGLGPLGVCLSSISVGRAVSTLNCVTRWASIRGVPANTARTFVGCAVSTLNRPPRRASIRLTMVSIPVTVAVVVAAPVAVPVARRWVILSIGRHEYAKCDCADKAGS
jgi:hypothetical protein